jgi:hypothetical protein
MPGDVADERADAVAERQHVQKRIGDVAEHARDRELAPDRRLRRHTGRKRGEKTEARSAWRRS